MKIVIVGGGAAGLMAAINIKNKDNDVIILEKNDEVGKKILVTGNGRCNLWNEDMNISKYNSSNKEILSKIFTQDIFTNTFNKLNNLFEFKIKNGYYYPYSNKAITVRDILVNECNRLGVEIRTNYSVNTIDKKDTFIINNKIECDKLIISTGGKSMPITGSDGSIYNELVKLGHTLIEPLPSLVPLYANEPYLNKWNGIRCDAKVTSIIDGIPCRSEQGEIQLTDNGLSGICIFNISSEIVAAINNNKNVSVEINFINIDNPIEYITNKYGDLTLNDVLLRYFDKKLIKIIIDKCDINPEAYIKSLTSKELSRLEKYLTKFNINITGYGDFNKSEVTQGGISLSDINPETFESNKIKDLYLIGEVLDINGLCGGYNLGFAWMSAIKVGDSIC